MDWMDNQVPPPSWHDEGEIIPNGPGDESYCPLTSMVRRCYVKHLEETLIQNYESCKTKTIQQSTLRDFILHWEQNALRACMMTAVYQRAMLQVINAVKSDTKENKLASVLTASVKKLKSHHFVDVSTQTDAVTPMGRDSSVINGHSTKSYPGLRSAKRMSVREPSLNKESSVEGSDGPFLTPPSDYPAPNMQSTKSCPQTFSRGGSTYSSQQPVEQTACNPSFPIPVHFSAPPPSYATLPQNPYPHVTTVNDWACKPENDFAAVSSVETPCDHSAVFLTPGTQESPAILNGYDMCNGYNQQLFQSNDENIGRVCSFIPADAQSTQANHCDGGETAHSDQPPQTEDTNMHQIQTCDTAKVEGQIICKVEKSPNYQDTEFTLGLNNVSEPDYNWDQIEEEMARLCGQVFTEANNHNNVESSERKPALPAVPEVPAGAVVPVVPEVPVPEPQDTWEVLATLYEEELEYKLEQLRNQWSLEKQANLKRKFIELFGREDNECDESTPISRREVAKCRQRIAPAVVKHLMPLYKKKRIASRQVFKSLAKHISALLIERNLYPDECDVWMGVQEFFVSGTTIECEADFCT